MSKKTLSNKSRYSVLKLSGFRSRMSTAQGRKTIQADPAFPSQQSMF